MKKALSIILALVMVVAVGTSAFAASNFYKSPSGRPAPEIILGENTSEDCFAWLEITGWGDRHTLPDEVRKDFEDAYNQIVNADNLVSICQELGDIAAQLGIPEDVLVLSDLFDISWYGCDDHRTHGEFRIQIKPEILDNFVALMQYIDGEWVVVDNAKVIGDGDILAFSVEEVSQFAIVVNTENEPVDPPYAGDDSFIVASIIIMVVSGAALIVVGVMIKKGRKDTQV